MYAITSITADIGRVEVYVVEGQDPRAAVLIDVHGGSEDALT